eukprot:Amastigsp_a511660_10.p1 type:complete len:206 gc:universal Amastigsp_a511660_10:632-15(-)
MVVFGFVAHAIDCEPSRAVVASCFYDETLNDDAKQERLAHIAERVISDIEFQQQCELSMQRGASSAAGSRRLAVAPDAPHTGAFRLAACDLFPIAGMIVWRQVLKTALVVLVPMDEHLGLASYFLEAFATLLSEHFKSERLLASPKELLTKKPEEVHVLLELMLPAGQLVLFNPSVVRQHLRKEAESLLLAKPGAPGPAGASSSK